MRKAFFILVVLMVIILSNGCSGTPCFATNWDAIEIGMSKEQVLELLGEPIGKSVPEEWSGKGESDPTRAAAAGFGGMLFGSLYEYWEYSPINAEELTEEQIIEKLFDSLFEPLDESFVVYFDVNGKVKKLRHPLKKPYATSREVSK